jgi:hypothetical protein
MIDEIKDIVKNYLNNATLTCFLTGTVVSDGIQVNENKEPIPMELIVGNLKSIIKTGDNVRLLRNHGGKQYYILEVIQ